MATMALIANSATTVMVPFMSKLVVDDIITPMNMAGFIWWIPLFLAITAGYYYTQYVSTWQIRILGENTVARIRQDIMSKLQIISLRYFSEGETGRIIARPINDANNVRIFFRMGFTSIIQNAGSLFLGIVIIFFLNVRLALLAVAVMPMAAIATYYLGLLSRKYNRGAFLNTSGMISTMQESLSGIKVIKSFVQLDRFNKHFNDEQDKVVKQRILAVLVSSIYQPVAYAIRVAGTALVLWYGAIMTMNGKITLGTFVAFTAFQIMFFNPILALVQAYDQYQQAMSATERMFDLIDTKPEVEDPPDDTAVQVGKSEKLNSEHVTFGYDPKIPVINDINFEIDHNTPKLAIVGPTGAGKSTIINLISRFYDPLNGSIKLNDQDIKNLRISDLRSHQSIVLQDSYLFPMCIRDNIRFGTPDATDEMVIEAAKMVGAHEFIMNLPRGYDYIIQEGSSNISIGQRQLISFARAILTNPDILILDEATSSIDPYTELVIQNALKNLLSNRLVIIIAHRLSTIRLCDEIVVIDHGRIVEWGTHEELMKADGIYSSFYKMQFKEEKGLNIDYGDPS
ncbi:MAG: ABC transporter ATP-binding protein [Candidatus Bathyarchaeia archaeon]|jgi:ATP-binding cassette subfamily B protein